MVYGLRTSHGNLFYSFFALRYPKMHFTGLSLALIGMAISPVFADGPAGTGNPDVSGKLDSASQRSLQSSAEFQKAEGIIRFVAIA